MGLTINVERLTKSAGADIASALFVLFNNKVVNPQLSILISQALCKRVHISLYKHS